MAAVRRLLIVYHSRTGGTQQMVQALHAGASRETSVHTLVLPASACTPQDMQQADGYVFACPENLAAMSGAMKEFFDRCYYPLLEQMQGRPYAILICAGSDGSNAARQITRIATGWRLQAVAEPLLVCTHAQTAEQIATPKHIPAPDLQRCHDLGLSLATGLSMGIF